MSRITTAFAIAALTACNSTSASPVVQPPPMEVNLGNRAILFVGFVEPEAKCIAISTGEVDDAVCKIGGGLAYCKAGGGVKPTCDAYVAPPQPPTTP